MKVASPLILFMSKKLLWWFDKAFWNGLSSWLLGFAVGEGKHVGVNIIAAFVVFTIGILIGTRDKDTGERLNT